jgi:palmitoyltransferase
MKQFLGIFLFSLTYIAIFSQAVGIYFTWDEDLLTYLLFHKIYFSVIAILAIVSHIRASFTNPGRITHDNNISILEFYISSHKNYTSKAEDLNIQYRQYFQMVKKTMPPDDGSDHSETESGDEEYEYSQNTEISDKKIDELNIETKMNFERCKKCFVVRVPNTHHCSKCQHCIMKMDHHCPWINNCVGLFNQKYFILFCYYCMIGCSYACFITSYYFIYLHKDAFMDSAFLITIYSLQVFCALVFIIFNIVMINDQWSAIKNDLTLIDYKKGKFIEARSLGEVLREVFGESFSPFWFLPVDRSTRRKIKKRRN